MLLSKATNISFQGTHLHSYQFLLFLGIEPMALPTLYCFSYRKAVKTDRPYFIPNFVILYTFLYVICVVVLILLLTIHLSYNVIFL